MTSLTSGKPTDRWAFLLPPGWARVPTPGTGVVYAPTEPIAGIVVPASIIETELFGVVGRSATEVAASVLGDAQESTAVDVDGRPGARVARTLGEAPREGGRPTARTRQVTYVVSRDDVDGDWLVLSFSTTYDTDRSTDRSTGRSSGPAEQLAETLVGFFDAVMTTFRWTGPGADPVNLPERTIPGSV